MREIIRFIKPRLFIPVHAGTLRRTYHATSGIEEGIPRNNVRLPENDDIFYFTNSFIEDGGQFAHGNLLVDQNVSVVSSLVVKDRLMLSKEGILTTVLTVNKKSGQLLTSSDIISRGFIAMKNNEELMNRFRSELQRAVQQRYKRVDMDRFKVEIKNLIFHFLYENTGLAPIVIPVIKCNWGQS